MVSAGKGFIGAMNTAKRNALPVEFLFNGARIYNTDNQTTEIYDATAEEWMPISAGYVFNPTKNRYELWLLCSGGPGSVLYDAYPARVLREHFIAGPILAPTLLGLSMEMEWSINGLRGGIANLAVDNFPPLNDIGGGINLCVVAAGGLDGDYTALHWGGNFPTTRLQSPTIHVVAEFTALTGAAHMIGLVDATRPDGAAAFALPDNGVFVYVDTALYGNDHLHYIVRAGGVNTLDLDLGTPPVGESCGTLYFSDDGNTVYLVLNGVVVSTFSGVLPNVQMQPYAAVVARGAPLANKCQYLRDFWFIMDLSF